MFSERAREYMVAYYELANEGQATASPISLRTRKKRNRHVEVDNISFSWISNMMQDIVHEMKDGEV